MCAALAGVYVATLLIPATRRFFELTVPSADMIVTALVASSVAIVALTLCGFSVTVARAPANGQPS